jgi:hypothetical protein
MTKKNEEIRFQEILEHNKEEDKLSTRVDELKKEKNQG